MELAKKKIDVGLSTNNLDPMLHFWQNDVGLGSTTFFRSAVVRSSTGMTPQDL